MKLRDVYKAVKGYNKKTNHTAKDIERYTEAVRLLQATNLKNGFIPCKVNEAVDDLNSLLATTEERYREFFDKELASLDLKEQRRLELFVMSIVDDAKEIVLNARHLDAEVGEDRNDKAKVLYFEDEKKPLSPHYHDTEETEERILELMAKDRENKEAFLGEANLPF